jgi:hypothetical protein
MKTTSLSFLLCLLLALSTGAEPFVLAEPELGARLWAPDRVMLAAGAEGFMLTGTTSHSPAAIPLSATGHPRIVGTVPLGIPSASSVGEAVWLEGRWIVPVMPDFLLRNRLVLTEVSPDGAIAGPHMIEWEGFAGGAIAWNGRSLAAAAGTVRPSTNLRDLRVRTIASDLSSAGTAHEVATEISGLAIAGTEAGFVVAWIDPSGVWIRYLDDSALPVSEAFLLGGAANVRQLDIAVHGSDLLVVWAEGEAPEWTFAGAVATGGGVPQATAPIAQLGGSSFPIVHAEPFGDGFAVAWQAVDYGQGRRLGREIVIQRLTRHGTIAEESWALPNLEGEELLTGLTSRGEELLLTYTRHLVGVGTPIWGTIITGRSSSDPHLVALSPAALQGFEVTSEGDGTTWGAWIESTGTGSMLKAARWNHAGEMIAASTLVDIPERIWGVDISSSGAGTLLAWHQGYAIFAAPLTEDASFAREPFYVAIGSSVSVPRDPAIAWDGERFVVAWKDAGGIAAAHVVPEGVQRGLGIVAGPPPEKEQRYYGIESFDLAAAGDTVVIVADISETSFCVGIPCPTRTLAGWAAAAAGASGAFELLSEGRFATAASNGTSFLVGWSDAEGVQLMPIDAGGRPGEIRLGFRWPATAAPALGRDGSNFLLAVSYAAADWSRVGLINVDASGTRLAPVRGFDTNDEQATLSLRITSTGGDALIGWLGRASAAAAHRSLMGQFASGTTATPAPPSAPSGVHVTPLGSTVRLRWNMVAEADEYHIQHRRSDWDGASRWTSGHRTEKTVMVTSPPPLRIFALGRGGASEPVVVEAPGRRRTVGRR